MALDLQKLFRDRQGDPVFARRDAAYKLFENYYLSRDPEGAEDSLTWRPANRDEYESGASSVRLSVNHTRRVHDYFTAMFARPPQLFSIPPSATPEGLHQADVLTNWMQMTLRRSHIKSQQPRQSHWMCLRGESVYGVDWDERNILVRTYDPAWCYPSFSDIDLGGVEDMLIVFQAEARWVEQRYRVALGTQQQYATVMTYWDAQQRVVQVDDVPVPWMTVNHGLGFVPFRWCFGSPDALLAQSDVREVPKLQDMFNEALLLALDSVRKSVDPAYYGTGLKKDLTPEPGTVLSIANENAKIAPFPSGGDPQMILGVMGQLESFLQSVAGVSPISATGQAQGSIVTGSAVRHQVEAIEQRVETKKSLVEDCFAQLGSQMLRVLSHRMKAKGEKEVSFSHQGRGFTLLGDEAAWSDCDAEYGGFLGLDISQRVQILLGGLGRLWDARYAIKAADLPGGVVPEDMAKRVDDYQINLATTSARAQTQAQKVAQEGQSPQPQPGQDGSSAGMTPSAPAPQPEPTGQDLMTGLDRIQAALQMLGLQGKVWAVGELAIAGMSAQPVLTVQKREDLEAVSALMASFHGSAVSGTPNGAPQVELA